LVPGLIEEEVQYVSYPRLPGGDGLEGWGISASSSAPSPDIVNILSFEEQVVVTARRTNRECLSQSSTTIGAVPSIEGEEEEE